MVLTENHIMDNQIMQIIFSNAQCSNIQPITSIRFTKFDTIYFTLLNSCLKLVHLFLIIEWKTFLKNRIKFNFMIKKIGKKMIHCSDKIYLNKILIINYINILY